MAQLKSMTVTGSLSAGQIELSGSTPAINFHYDNISSVTSSIKEISSGKLNITDKLTVNGIPVSLEGHESEHGWSTDGSFIINLRLESICNSDTTYTAKYNSDLDMVYIRGYFEIVPTADISAGSIVKLATMESSIYYPAYIHSLAAYRAANMRAHAIINSSGEINIRCSGTLTSGTSYGFYITGFYYRT